MSCLTKGCLSVLMGDCAQLDLGSMGTRPGTGTGATGSRCNLCHMINSLPNTLLPPRGEVCHTKTGGRTALLYFFGMNVLLKFLLMSLFESPAFGRVKLLVCLLQVGSTWILGITRERHKRAYGNCWLYCKLVVCFALRLLWKHTEMNSNPDVSLLWLLFK